MKATPLVIILTLFLLWQPAECQWVQTNGPYGGTILSLAVMDSVILAGTQYCGAYYSTDYGENWSPIDGIPDTADVSWFAVYGHTIVAEIEDSSPTEPPILISTNGGKNWHPSATQVYGPMAFADSILFMGNSSVGMSLSTDFGETWNAANNGIGHLQTFALAVAQGTDNENGKRIYAATDSGLFVSTDFGTNWAEVDSGMAEKYVVSVAAIGMNVVVSTFHSGVFFSTNGGTTWSAANTQMNQCDCFSVSDSTIFAGTGSGLFRSTDKGISWIPVNNGFPASYQTIHAIAVVPQKTSSATPILFAGIYYKGVFRSTNNGANWESVCHGILAHSMEFVGTLPNGNGGMNLFADCLGGAGGLFISTDKGVSWREDTTAGLSQYEITSLAESGNKLFISTAGAGIFRSKDYGITWSPIDSGLDNPVNIGLKVTSFTSLAGSGTDIYAGGCFDLQMVATAGFIPGS